MTNGQQGKHGAPQQVQAPVPQQVQTAASPAPFDMQSDRYRRDEAAQRYQQTVQGTRRRGKALKVVGIALAAVLLVLLAFVFFPSGITAGPSYVLLLGTDESIARNNDTSENSLNGIYRTDTIILARIDPGSKHVTLISMPRDTQVELEGYGTQKLNAAFAFGGKDMAIDAVSKIAGVPISHYALVDMDGLANVVDTLGGIEVNVPIPIDDWEAEGTLDAGLQTLNGEQALVFCRSRTPFEEYGSGDGYRTANQRIVLQAIADKMLSSDPVTQVSSVMSFASSVTTDLSVLDCIRLALVFRGSDAGSAIYTGTMPTVSSYEDDLWYEIIDEEAWTQMMKRVDAGLPPSEESIVDDATGTVFANSGDQAASGSAVDASASVSRVDSISVRNGAGVAGVATTAADKLKEAGFNVVDSGNADTFDYPYTVVIYDDASKAQKAQQIADTLGAGVFLNDGTYSFEADFLVVVGQDFLM